MLTSAVAGGVAASAEEWTGATATVARRSRVMVAGAAKGWAETEPADARGKRDPSPRGDPWDSPRPSSLADARVLLLDSTDAVPTGGTRPV